MFRLFKLNPYQKTPLFPKAPHDPGDNNTKDIKEQDIDKNTAKETEYVDDVILLKIPILFRSLKRDDLYSIPEKFNGRLVGYSRDTIVPTANPPPISQIFPDFKYPGNYYWLFNNAIFGYEGNIILFSLLKDDDESEFTPILMKKEIADNHLASKTLCVLLPIEFSNISKNHQLARGLRLDWKDSTIDLELGNGSDTYSKLVKTVSYEIDIQYLSFDARLDYMYIRIPGFKKEMLKIPLRNKYREDEERTKQLN